MAEEPLKQIWCPACGKQERCNHRWQERFAAHVRFLIHQDKRAVVELQDILDEVFREGGTRDEPPNGAMPLDPPEDYSSHYPANSGLEKESPPED